MIIPDYIIVKNASGQIVAFLSPDDGLKDCYIDVRLNGERALELLLPANSEKLAEITPECRIIAGGREYILLKEDAIDFERTEDNKLWAKIMAVESWKLLGTQYPEPYISNDPTTPIPADLAVIIVGGGSDLSGGRYPVGSAGHAMYAVLNGSGWSVGTVDVTGTHDLEMEKVSRLELVKAIQEIWGGYLVWDSINKTVSLRNANTWQNYTGFQIRYAKNLKHITRTQSNRIITKLYPFGHDDLDIASVNGGVKYITNFSYTPREYVGIYKNQDIYDAQELKEKAIAELSLICRPRYLYSEKMVDLRTLPEYSHEDFALGDMVDVIDPDVAPDSPRVRIIRHKYNIFKPWECELEIGDPEERLVEQLKASFDTTSFVGGKFNGSGKFSGYSLEYESVSANKIKTNELVVGDNIAMGPNAYISWNNVTQKPDIGQIALDKINATYIDANGVWTPNVYATNISTLKGKITTAQIEDLIVGGNVIMGPNAKISWSQVTDRPYIPVLPDYIKSTYIDSTTVQSPNIVGGTITGGTIIGGSISSNTTINVGTDARVGKNLYLGAQGDNTPKTIYFNEFTYIKGSTGIVGTDIEIGCHEVFFGGLLDGNISFIGSMNFSNSSVSGLENSGYVKQSAIDSALAAHVAAYHST